MINVYDYCMFHILQKFQDTIDSFVKYTTLLRTIRREVNITERVQITCENVLDVIHRGKIRKKLRIKLFLFPAEFSRKSSLKIYEL